MVRIGFVVLSYNQPSQVLRLVNALNASFGSPPIVCHHNFAQSFLDEGLFSRNVRFVHPHVVTQWGHISTPLAALRAFSLLRSFARIDWFVLLSGSDYPVRRSDEILAELANSEYDAYLQNREIPYELRPSCDPLVDIDNANYGWVCLAQKRYCTFGVSGEPSRSVIKTEGESTWLMRMRLIDKWCSLNRPRQIYGGCFWFEARSIVMDCLIDDSSMRGLIRYYRHRVIPEESLFHTAILRHADLRVCGNNKRYEDWTSGGPHPKWLNEEDLPGIRSSGAHFARKFRPDGVLQQLVDGEILGHSARLGMTEDCTVSHPGPSADGQSR